MRLAKVGVLVVVSSVANFNSFPLKFGQHGILDRHAVVNGCEVEPGDCISHAPDDMVDEDIGGSLKSLKCFKGQFDYLFFVLVHVDWFWLGWGWNPAGLVRSFQFFRWDNRAPFEMQHRCRWIRLL